MRQVAFKTVLPLYYEKSLEELLFFHPNQHYYARAIEYNLLHYGEIKLVHKNENLIISLSKVKARSLFILDSPSDHATLLGSAIYFLDKESVVVVHISVLSECGEKSLFQMELITYRMLEKLRSIYSQNRYKDLLLPYYGKRLSINNRITTVVD